MYESNLNCNSENRYYMTYCTEEKLTFHSDCNSRARLYKYFISILYLKFIYTECLDIIKHIDERKTFFKTHEKCPKSHEYENHHIGQNLWEIRNCDATS